MQHDFAPSETRPSVIDAVLEQIRLLRRAYSPVMLGATAAAQAHHVLDVLEEQVAALGAQRRRTGLQQLSLVPDSSVAWGNVAEGSGELGTASTALPLLPYDQVTPVTGTQVWTTPAQEADADTDIPRTATPADEFEQPVQAFRRTVPPSHIEALALRLDPASHTPMSPFSERSDLQASPGDVAATAARAPTPRQWAFEPEPPDDAPEPDDPVRSALRESAIAAVRRMRAAAPHSGGVSMVPDASTEPVPCPDSAASESAIPHHTGGVSSSKNAPADRSPSSAGGIRSPARPGAPAWVSRPGIPTGAALQNMSRVSATPPTV